MSLSRKINLNKLKQFFHSSRFIFYSNLLLFVTIFFCWKIFTLEISRHQTLLQSLLVFSIFLPLILTVKEKISFLLFSIIPFANILFFLCATDNLLPESLRNDLIILSSIGIIFLPLLTMFLRSKISDLSRKITICLYITITSLPLLCYFSFDLERVINAYHISVLIGDVQENFWNNHAVKYAFFGLGIRITILFVCVFIIQLSLPVPKFKCNWTVLFFTILTASFLSYELISLYVMPKKLSFNLADAKKGIYRNRSNPLADGSYDVKNNSVPGLYFLIIGESHEYKPACDALLNKDTFFNSIHKDPGYFIFKNVSYLSSNDNKDPNYGGISELNVCNMMSFAPQLVDVQRLVQEPDFLDLMQHLKFKTLFIHNAGQWLIFNLTMHAMFRRADFSLITDRSSYGRKYRDYGFQVDNELPGVLKKLYKDDVFNKKQSFTVIKPLGLHNGVVVIPDDFARKHKNMNTKEQGLLYYDNILANIVSVLRSFPETRAVVYCSDHGTDGKGNKNNIVMFVYLSEELQKLRPELAGKIKKFSLENFRNIDIDKLLLEIMDISVVKKYPLTQPDK